MNRLTLGILLGLAAGALDALFMLPMKFSDKSTAIKAAFTSRFAIGFLAVNVTLPLHPPFAGALVGFLISIPDAIITRAYLPIMTTGLLFGALAGWAGQVWAA